MRNCTTHRSAIYGRYGAELKLCTGRVKGILNQSVYLKKRSSTSYSGQELTEIFAVPSLYVYVALAINYYYGIIYIELNLSGCCTNYNANFEIEWLCSCVSCSTVHKVEASLLGSPVY